MYKKIKKFLLSSKGVFLVGVLIGWAVFTYIYGLKVVNPTETNWIWQPATHDTAQHQLGWEFYRANSSGDIINDLAYPSGLSVVFMDVIPLMALIFKPFSTILPASFQYFGIWGLLCYLLMGGLSALILAKIWRKVVKGKSLWQLLFIASGALIFSVSPVLMARTFYHPALAGQWIILLGFLIIIDTPKFRRLWQPILAWSTVLILAILIHPYFLPMMGALAAISAIRYWRMTLGSAGQRIIQVLAIIVAPTALSLIIFALLGGFSLGTGTEVYDLEDKGFNLLSFINSWGYSSVAPSFATRSTSSESMMWLGLGVLITAVLAFTMSVSSYRSWWRKAKVALIGRKGEVISIGAVLLALLVFSVGTRVEAGSMTLLQYSVPDKIYELWSAFRAAAREAWPFYYAFVFVVLTWLALAIKNYQPKYRAVVVACSALLLASVQAVDILGSTSAVAKRESFAHITELGAEFEALDLSDIVNGREHLVALDEGFRGDQFGTYVIGRTALKYNPTLNTGFFARLPESAKATQATWRELLCSYDITGATDDNIFFTSDQALADSLSEHYELIKVDKWWFVLQ